MGCFKDTSDVPGLQKILDEWLLGCLSWPNLSSFLHMRQDAGVVTEWPVDVGEPTQLSGPSGLNLWPCLPSAGMAWLPRGALGNSQSFWAAALLSLAEAKVIESLESQPRAPKESFCICDEASRSSDLRASSIDSMVVPLLLLECVCVQKALPSMNPLLTA